MTGQRLFTFLFVTLLAANAWAQQPPKSDHLTVEKSETGLAENYLYDVGIQSDSVVIFASGFENGFEGWSAFDHKVSEIITDPDIAFAGNKVLKLTATRGVDTGGDVDYNIYPHQDQIYLRFYTKLDENTVTPHHFVKIFANPEGVYSPAGTRTPGDKAF